MPTCSSFAWPKLPYILQIFFRIFNMRLCSFPSFNTGSFLLLVNFHAFLEKGDRQMFTYSNIFLDNISTFLSTSEYPLDSSTLEKRRRLYNYMIFLIENHKKSIDKLLEIIREFYKMNIITSVSLTIYPLKVPDISPVSPHGWVLYVSLHHFLTNHFTFDSHILTYAPRYCRSWSFPPHLVIFLVITANFFWSLFFLHLEPYLMLLISLSLKHHPSVI